MQQKQVMTDPSRDAANWVAFSALLLALAVLIGAFGAHGLKNLVTPERLAVFHTGVEYQFYQGLGLLALSLWRSLGAQLELAAVQRLLLIGTVIFSGSLYLLVLSGLGWLGAVTPIGGLLMVAGWLLLAWRAIKKPAEAG
jgi:uncharacterized membrane protein YgdD (TMEM256/DUF423 family)